MKTVTFFETEDELRDLTCLTHDQLWAVGFNLDDWDFGFVSDSEWSEEAWWSNNDSSRYYEYFLLSHMENHCCGYQHTEYKGRHYYMVYHS